MENSKESAAADKPGNTPDPNPNRNHDTAAGGGGGGGSGQDYAAAAAAAAEAEEEARRPFTSLSQVDADLALARVLQEQERAYMMLRMNGVEGSEYGSSEGGSYEYEEDGDEDYEEELHRHGHPDEQVDAAGIGGSQEGSEYGEDAFDANEDEVVEDAEPEIDPGEYEDDEAYARALQEAEEREVAARLMALAGLSDWRAVEHEEHVHDPQDAWQEVDPDEYSYEELVALGEVVGTESRGLSADTLASLPSVTYKAQHMQDGNTEQCVICRVEFEDDESLVALPCKHSYHPECINKWLQINKVCPMCSAEVSTSENKQE